MVKNILNNKKVMCFDIDNVICKTQGLNYKKSKKIQKTINLINELYENGFFIKIFTARFMGRNNENILKAKRQGYKFTVKQLNKWGLKYNKLYFGKPTFDIYVDDKNFQFKKNWQSDFKKKYLK